MAFIFPSFFDHPKKVKFSEQEDTEVIELFLRQHWVVNVNWILSVIIAFFLPILFVLIDPITFNIIVKTPLEIITGALIIYYLLLIAYIIERFLFWYYNVYIITNLHLVDINFVSLLSRDIVEVEIADVESSKSKINGIIQSLFNFGDVIVETAAEHQKINFLKVPRPDFVADRIQDVKVNITGGN